MRPNLWTPEGELTSELLSQTLALVGVHVPPSLIDPWTKLERVLAYDWGWREYLKASDAPVKLRDKPSFVTAGEKSWLP